jgi:hypothetical protein
MSSENNIFKLRRTIETRAHLERLARERTEQALNIIVGIMNAPTTSDRDRLTAAFGLLDRGWVNGGSECGKAED